MCGIAGFIDPKLTTDKTDEVIQAMLEAISHRGPDARGIFSDEVVCLGHNRLSIIDLSAEANQPMHFEDYVIIFNGEIYNYIEIRERLKKLGYRFITQSDTEVILAAYKEWGEEAVKEFMGMWALVIWNKKKRTLFASRDRFGIKPFYFIHQNKQFYFGSEYKAIKKSPLFSSDLNMDVLSLYFQIGWISYSDQTFFTKVTSLLPAHNLLFDADKGVISIHKYWDIDTTKHSDLSFEEKREVFYELFANSVSQHMRSDVTQGSALSGGLDSSSIVAMVHKLNPGIHYKSFSIFYDGPGDVDERPFINSLIKKYPTIDAHYFTPTMQDIEESMHQAFYFADVPSNASSLLSHYFLMRMIRQNDVTVVLDGQGSDEYLGGYNHTFYRTVADQLSSGHLINALSTTGEVNKNLKAGLGKSIKHFGKSILSLTHKEQSLYELEYKNYYPFMTTADKNKIPFNLEKKPGNKLTNFLYHLIFTTSLQSILHYEDRMAMAFSIESRVPFLDHRLVEFCFTLNNDDKVHGPVTKYMLRKSLEKILPADIAFRKDKQGFTTPGETKWLRGPLKHLLEVDYSMLDTMDVKKVKSLIADYKAGNNAYAKLVWKTVTFAYWMKHFKDK